MSRSKKRFPVHSSKSAKWFQRNTNKRLRLQTRMALHRSATEWDALIVPCIWDARERGRSPKEYRHYVRQPVRYWVECLGTQWLLNHTVRIYRK